MIYEHDYMAVNLVHFDSKNKVTVVVFKDGSKEMCKCAKGDEFNEYAGMCICLAKHLYKRRYLEKIINTKSKRLYNDNNKERSK